jgi:tRNA (guanine-N7-)-methyltransferase
MPTPAIPDLRPWFQTLDALPPGVWNWGEIFGNDHGVELEVGCGRGLFLVTAGTARPETNFLGIDNDFKEARRAARRLQKRALPNVRILGADARIVLARHLPAHSLDAVHVYFPDPWWKRRHRKRRIFNTEFVAQVARLLRPEGELHSWTDVEEYFAVIQELVAAHPAFVSIPPPDEQMPKFDMDYRTSFERKKRKLGLPIFRARWRCTGADVDCPPAAPPAL